MKFNELESVRTLKDFPDYGVKKGEVGVIIVAFKKPNEAYEVEFSDNNGRPKATLPILPEYLELFL